MDKHHTLRTKPIHPHLADTEKFLKPGKTRRPPGDPVSEPKPHPYYISPPDTNLVNLSLDMEIILPNEAETAKPAESLVFHAVGDTGGYYGDEVEKAISNAMDQQISAPENKRLTPAFYYHLGDVIYQNGQSYLYDSQFYEPYQYYHAKIFAIAGNHDGNNRVRPGDEVDTEPSLYGFMRNFCDDTSRYDSPYRATMTQPYVYWTFNTPLATIVGLYSNVDGTLDPRGSSEQLQWFQQQIADAPSEKEKALILAVHHPPYSLDEWHGGYPDIEIAIDRVMEATGRIPTIVLSAHVHSYQRFERMLQFPTRKHVPYIIAGAGGYANDLRHLHKIEKDANGQLLPQGGQGFQTTHEDLKLMSYNDQNPGFLRISIDGQKKTLTSEYFVVPFETLEVERKVYDHVTVPW
jgi:hypothetical protein